MSMWLAIPFFALALIVGVWSNNNRENQCERNGLGQWHYWTQVCEPIEKVQQ